MDASVTIRRARLEDADAIVAVLRRSIVELCVDDHHHDPEILGPWLQNKTVANARAWIEAAGNSVAVAQGRDGLCGVASLSAAGTILLCYVLPEAQFKGVGRALLESIEAEARLRGFREISLESTISARAFYRRHGYEPSPDGEPDSPVLYKVLMV